MADTLTRRRRYEEPPPAIELSREEVVARLEAGAKRRLDISAVELVRRYRRGELEDPGAVADLLALLDLLEADDPLVAS